MTQKKKEKKKEKEKDVYDIWFPSWHLHVQS